jgi:hydroxyacylglutathione hydrolase
MLRRTTPVVRVRRRRPEPPERLVSSGAMYLRQFVVEGLGHISALVADDAKGVAAVVDPRRDVDVYLREAAARGLRITHVAETHLHNDYVSGGRELAALTGAEHVIGAGAELAYDHRPVRQDDTFDVGALRFTVLETPGHTPEHVAYAVADRSRADEPVHLFTGGSLLVGAVGRTDLLGPERAEPGARQMFASLHGRVLRHEDFVSVLPTHGGGSLCSKDIATTPQSTIGFERRHNGLLGIADVDAFVRALLTDQPAFPRYFRHMRPLNQSGPTPVGRVPEGEPLSVERVAQLVAGEHVVVDLRTPGEFAVAHVPGAISIPAGSSFGTWLGWVVPFGQPLVLILPSAAEWDDAVRQALRIGYDEVAGHLQGGFARWQDAGQPLESSGGATVGQLRAFLAGGRAGDHGPLVLDVRQADEYERGHVPGAVHLMAGDLPDRLGDLPRDRPIMTICASGYRSSVAASLLRRAGFEDVTWVSGGVPAWRAAGYPVESGAA